MKYLVALTLFLRPAVAWAAGIDYWSALSPGDKLIAFERRIPDLEVPNHLDHDGCAVTICSTENGVRESLVAQHNFVGRIISQICWSPDSRFLLFTTASSGGHSPWNFKTYLFCAADKSFRDVQGAAGATVGAGEFGFEPPDVALLTVNVVPAESVKRIKLPLGKLVRKMERLP